MTAGGYGSLLFIQFFWIEERFRGKGHGTTSEIE